MATPARRFREGIDFRGTNTLALASLPQLVRCWLPGGVIRGREYIVRNPRRDDRHLGSFKINLSTGRWADFATGDRGGDPVSLLAYLRSISQGEAARSLAADLQLKRWHVDAAPTGRRTRRNGLGDQVP